MVNLKFVLKKVWVYDLGRDWAKVGQKFGFKGHCTCYICLWLCSSTFSESSLHQCFQLAVRNKQNHYINLLQYYSTDERYVILLKFCIDACSDCWDTVKFWLQKDKYTEKVSIKEKIMPPTGLKPMTSCMQVIGWASVFCFQLICDRIWENQPLCHIWNLKYLWPKQCIVQYKSTL